MRFFDKISEACFHDQEDGTSLFYPNGMLCKGRIISDPERKIAAFRGHRRNLIISIIAGFIIGAGAPTFLLHEGMSANATYAIMLAVIVASMVVQAVSNWFLVHDLPTTDKKLSVKVQTAKSVRALPLSFWRFCLGFGVIIIPLYFVLKIFFPNELDEHEKTNEYAFAMVGMGITLIGLGWWGCSSYKHSEPSVSFNEKEQPEDITAMIPETDKIASDSV